MHGMNSEDVRRYIAGEVRAEVARQRRTSMSAAKVLGKSRAAFSHQFRGKGDYRPLELLALAEWLGVDVERFLPPGYALGWIGPKDRVAS